MDYFSRLLCMKGWRGGDWLILSAYAVCRTGRGGNMDYFSRLLSRAGRGGDMDYFSRLRCMKGWRGGDWLFFPPTPYAGLEGEETWIILAPCAV